MKGEGIVVGLLSIAAWLCTFIVSEEQKIIYICIGIFGLLFAVFLELYGRNKDVNVLEGEA